MTTELSVLAWGCVLGLVHLFVAVRAKTRQYGTKWNVGARDEELPPPAPVVGRLTRAQANFFETCPIFAAAVLIDAAAGLDTPWTALGALIWLGARILYLPLYAFGVPAVRTGVWMLGMVGIALVLWPPLAAAFQVQ
jgi:uncharacterized MAPEG superfamily protein